MSRPFQTVGNQAQMSGAGQVEVKHGASFAGISVYQDVCNAWLRRRTEDMRIGMEAAQRLSECRDITQAAAIYSTWVSESVNRLQEEFSTIGEQNSALGNQYMSALTGLANLIPNRVGQATSATIKRFG